jgi:membrane-associated HD superfamily phosphohydrolase
LQLLDESGVLLLLLGRLHQGLLSSSQLLPSLLSLLVPSVFKLLQFSLELNNLLLLLLQRLLKAFNLALGVRQLLLQVVHLVGRAQLTWRRSLAGTSCSHVCLVQVHLLLFQLLDQHLQLCLEPLLLHGALLQLLLSLLQVLLHLFQLGVGRLLPSRLLLVNHRLQVGLLLSKLLLFVRQLVFVHPDLVIELLYLLF